jgi:hypothetical protein
MKLLVYNFSNIIILKLRMIHKLDTFIFQYYKIHFTLTNSLYKKNNNGVLYQNNNIAFIKKMPLVILLFYLR